jgi:hypothetical protein
LIPAEEKSVDGRELVEVVRSAARAHSMSWEALVPDQFTVNFAHEAAEEAAYDAMAAAKAALRDHICDTYGITARELASLALP